MKYEVVSQYEIIRNLMMSPILTRGRWYKCHMNKMNALDLYSKIYVYYNLIFLSEILDFYENAYKLKVISQQNNEVPTISQN